MADCATIDARLARARATYEDWINGNTVSRFVDQNGESVTYSKGGIDRLQAHIRTLENEKAECSGNRFSAYRGPIKFTYGRRCR